MVVLIYFIVFAQCENNGSAVQMKVSVYERCRLCLQTNNETEFQKIFFEEV